MTFRQTKGLCVFLFVWLFLTCDTQSRNHLLTTCWHSNQLMFLHYYMRTQYSRPFSTQLETLKVSFHRSQLIWYYVDKINTHAHRNVTFKTCFVTDRISVSRSVFVLHVQRKIVRRCISQKKQLFCLCCCFGVYCSQEATTPPQQHTHTHTERKCTGKASACQKSSRSDYINVEIRR